jgi:epsin
MRDRMLGNIADSGLQGEEDLGSRSPGSERRTRPTPARRGGDDDEELQRALQMSMDSSADENRRRSQAQKEEDELAKALRISEEDDAKRKREQEEANQRALMDDGFQIQSNNQYAQPQQQQQMNTGFPLVDLSNQQPLQPQFTSYNVSNRVLPCANSQPFYAQMLAQQQQQQQQDEYMRQQMLMQQQQQMQEQQMLQQQQQQLFAQPTGYGSNNPFAPQQPQTSLLDPQPTATQSSFTPMTSFTQQQTPTPAQSSLSPPISPAAAAPKPEWQKQQQNKKDDGDHAGLANLLARGREDGLDTFGNQGNLSEYHCLVFLPCLCLHAQARLRNCSSSHSLVPAAT